LKDLKKLNRRLIGMAADSGKATVSLVSRGGDFGGPLFDVEGKLIGIHSNIGGTEKPRKFR
tara:strand:+ start:488 stop:670 length:183 start_codon:yes stop_codon:yes gene_type:complete